MNRASAYQVGVVLLLVSAVVFSTVGIFTKSVTAGAWSIIFWRGVSAAAFTITYVFYKNRVRQEFHLMGKSGISVAIIGAAGTVALIPAFQYTSIANVSLIYASAPFIAAAIAWLWFKEKPTTQVIVSSVLAVVGVIVIFSGSVKSGSSDYVRGDLLALWMTFAMALMIVVYRRYPNTPGPGPATLSSLLLCPLCLLLDNPFDESIRDIFVLIAFGLIFAIASVTLAEGAKRVPSGEATLISALETPLAPIWALIVFLEKPSLATVIGGSIVFFAILASQKSNLLFVFRRLATVRAGS